MNRLAEHSGVIVVKKGKLYVLRGRKLNRNGDGKRPLSAKRCLARMVTVAQFGKKSGGWGMTRDEIRDVIRLTDIDAHGTKAHEEQAIREVLS